MEESAKRWITPSGANEMRNKIYLARRFLTIACPLTVCFVPGILFYSFATNPNSSQYSKRLIFFQIFWSSILTLQAFPVVNATLWLITHIYLTTCYSSLQLDAISLTIDQLLSSSKWTLAQSNKIAIIDTKTRSLAKVDHINQRVRSIVDSHNYTSGYIFKLSDQIKYYIAIGYFYASFGADFLLYSATAMPKDHLYNNIIVTGLGIEILFFAMALILVLSKISVKASSSYGKYHMIIEKVQPEVMTKLKIRAVLSTISDTFIGFYIGDVFEATMFQYVEFILGNCSMMLMLIGIMKQIT
ncbi:uncharacterized protein LOC128389162 isoform X2 [Panonychus citri]|uniref:uncharacterized protein LOC128389162 isoform X2 n=1 Tax=Panonychus citri TaxID=50023 RepID=UPI002307B50E|nr:uncharacterized protein LOC128389162 isoform X2 [Panonychus citri]XP_053204676.1 uncharacterized protein LOC128389162 isoform X2 [Panonychus citri]